MKLIGKYAINYNTCIYRDLLEQYGLVNNEANEMLKNINNLRFGEALGQLMKNSEYTFKFLEDTVRLSKTEISYMKKNEKLNKIDVISVCLAINAPSSISKKMLKLANINLDVNLIEEDKIYNKLLHLKWANDYISLIKELASKKLSHLLRSKI